MEKQYTALLYSKYSKHCTDLINRIDLSNIDFTKETKLLPVCIDNDEIRKKIISSTNIEIHSVPTVLIIYEDGGVEKYEGEDAFSWVEDIINKKSLQKPLQLPQNAQQPPVQPPMQPPMQQPTQPPMQQPTQPPMQPHMQPPMQHIQPHMQQPTQPPMQPPMQPNRQPPMQQESPEGLTSIEGMEPDLEPIYEEELSGYQNFDREDVFPPKNATLRTGPNSYEVNTSFGKKKSELKIVRGIKSTNTSNEKQKKGKTDVMSAAMEMQKSREKEEEGLPKAPF